MAISIGSTTSSADIWDIVDQLIALERQPLDKLEKKRSTLVDKKTDFTQLDSALEALQSALSALILDSAFSSRTATSSDSDVVTATASAGAISGVHDFIVRQLAQSQVLMSDRVDTILASSGNTADTDLGLAGTFTVDDGTDFATITVVATDSLNQIATKINNAKYNSDGTTDLKVTASVVDYRLSLQRNDSGTTEMSLADTAGSVLNDLGVFIDHIISGTNIQVAGGSAGLTAATAAGGTANTRTIYTGPVTSFDSVTVSSNASATDGSITLEYSTDGNSWTSLGALTSDTQTVDFASAITGETQIEFRVKLVDAAGVTLPTVGDITLNYTDQAGNSQTLTDDFTDTETNQIKVGRNAYFSVDGLGITRTKNSNLTDVIEDVTLNLVGTSSTETGGGYKDTTLTVATNADTAVSSAKAFVSKFNSALSTINGKLKAGEPLESDSMLRYMKRKLIDTVMSTVSNPGRYSYLTDIGISYDHKAGTLSLNETTFRNELASHPGDLADFFGYDSDSDGVRDDGGLANGLDTYLEGYTSASIGLLAKRRDNSDVQIESIDRRIERWETRLEKRSQALFDQYVELFNAMNSLSAQSNQLATLQQYSLLAQYASG